MKTRYLVTTLLFGGLLITGCTNQDQSQPDATNDNNEPEQTETQNKTDMDQNTDTTDTQSSQDQAAESEDESSSTDPSDESSSTENESASLPEGVDKKEFESSKEAASYLDGYQKVSQTNIDLGHDIEGLQDSGTGHKYITWNEGNWYIGLDYPTDSKYALDKYADQENLAKDIVTYLESHYLPAPEDKGVIKIRGFNDSPQTKIQWQKGKVVYEIVSDENNPMETLQKAVDAGKKL